MTPDRTQSNPRLSEAIAEQTIAEADGEAAPLRARLARFVDAADALRHNPYVDDAIETEQAQAEYDAARAALLAASEAETIPPADACPSTPVTHGAPTAVDQALARIDSDRYSDFQDAVDALKTAHHSGTPDEAIAAQSEVKRALRALLGGAEGRGYRRATADACRLLDDTIESIDHGNVDAVDALDRFRAKLLDGCHIGAAERAKEGERG